MPVVNDLSRPLDGERLAGLGRAVESLAESTDHLVHSAPRPDQMAGVVSRGHFRPDEESILLDWFARFLTVRHALWEVIGEASAPVDGDVNRILDERGWRCFVLGYTSACLIVRLDRMLIEDVATHTLVQRKLNEGSEAHRIPRKQYTAVFESFTSPRKASAMDQAMRFARRHRRKLSMMVEDEVVGSLASKIEAREEVLDPSRRRYLARLLTFLGHAIRRRGASARQQAIFATLEASGRVVSELHDTWTPCRVNAELQRRLANRLRPGDVIVTRHDRAVTNLFLPGYWPHAALYVGSEDDRVRLQVRIDSERASRWIGDCRVLEALKDGVLFRPLEQTLAVDAVAVIRPQLDDSTIAQGIARAVAHEGKLYNFDFDFFRSDRLVCTEVVYRAYDGLGAVDLQLHERSGRPTLSAEDLLDLALDGEGFDPVAVCGATSCTNQLIEGPDARDAIAQSYLS